MKRNEALQVIPEIVKRYAAGESMQDLAAEHGVHRQRLYEWMLAGIGDENYHDLVTKVLVRRVSETDEALENPEIEPDTARAHARARFARMDLERRRPALYGAKQVVDVTVRVDVSERLQTKAAELLEHVVEAQQTEYQNCELETMDVLSNPLSAKDVSR